MATVDYLVTRVGEFKGDTAEQKRDFERAVTGIETIDLYVSALETKLKGKTGFSPVRLPPKGEVKVKEFVEGEVTFAVKSHTQIGKPSYKSAVEEFEDILTGFAYQNLEGRAVTGLAKVGDSLYVTVDSLLFSYDNAVAKIMKPTVVHNIEMTLEEALLNAVVPEKLVLDPATAAISQESFRNYALALKMREVLTGFSTAYNAALNEATEAAPGIVQVNARAGYETKKVRVKTPSYSYVVKTLVTVPTDRKQEEGELNILADADRSLKELRKELPFYDLVVREPRGVPTLYVGIESVYGRIQDLKTESITKSTRQTRKHVEIV